MGSLESDHPVDARKQVSAGGLESERESTAEAEGEVTLAPLTLHLRGHRSSRGAPVQNIRETLSRVEGFGPFVLA